MTHLETLKAACVDKIKSCLRAYSMEDFEIQLTWVTGKSWGGQAWTAQAIVSNKICKIDLCEDYLYNYKDTYIADTVIHEVAHVITAYLYPRRKQEHGKEWKLVMMQLGSKPNRFHNMVPSKCLANQYVCACKVRHLTDRMASLHKTRQYKCTLCGVILEQSLTGELQMTADQILIELGVNS